MLEPAHNAAGSGAARRRPGLGIRVRRQFGAVLLAVALASALGANAADPAAVPAADPQRLSEITQALSADSFEGRGPATAAEPKVIAFITQMMQSAGLKPAGEHDSWTQDVPLVTFQTVGPGALSLSYGGVRRVLRQSEDIAAGPGRPVDQVTIDAAPLIFVGYGVTAPELGWDDYKGLDMHGKIAVILINDPDFEATADEPVAGRFGGRAMTYYGRWTYKFEEAARRGALGALIVHETDAAAYGWNVVKDSGKKAQFDIVRDDPAAVHPLLQGWIQQDLARDLFAASGLDFTAAKTTARRSDFTPVALSASFSADLKVSHSRIVSHNILGKIDGSRHPLQTVFYTAHWDHLGVGEADAQGDRIYNGAIDNADGVASILEIARLFSHAAKPERTLVFMAVTAEEEGLLGSDYYASHPLMPLALTVADINIDALSGAGPARDVGVAGDSKGELQDLFAALAVKQGRSFSPDPEPEAGHFFRSDHFPFSKRGVPAISIESGTDLVVGGRALGMARRKDYVTHRYHQPSDQWSPEIDFRGMALDVDLAYRLGSALANSDIWPGWKADSEFKAVRDATAAERR